MKYLNCLLIYLEIYPKVDIIIQLWNKCVSYVRYKITFEESATCKLGPVLASWQTNNFIGYQSKWVGIININQIVALERTVDDAYFCDFRKRWSIIIWQIFNLRVETSVRIYNTEIQLRQFNLMLGKLVYLFLFTLKR